MKFTNIILSSISQSINSGRPLNGMLTAAEYLSGDAPLFRALAHMARPMFKEARYRAVQGLIAEVLAGKSLGAFTAKDQAQLRAITEGAHTSASRKAFVPTSLSARLARRGTDTNRRGVTLELTSRVHRAGRVAARISA